MSGALLGPAVMARSRRGRMRIPRAALAGPRTYVLPNVVPSIVPSAPPDFDTERFGVCGRWNGDLVQVPRDDATKRLARFLAVNAAPTPEQGWAAAEKAMPGCFIGHRVLRLFDRTLVLPAGNVVFKVEDVPAGKLPDDPPDRVYALTTSAMISQPGATFSLLTPIFDVPPVLEDPVRLVTPDQLATMQVLGRMRVEQDAARWGWWYRREAQAEARRKALEVEAERARKLVVVPPPQAWRIPVVETPPVLSPRLRAVQERVRSRLFRESGAQELAMNELLRFRRFDPLVVYETSDAPGQLRLVIHWMKIQDRAGKPHMLLHE